MSSHWPYCWRIVTFDTIPLHLTSLNPLRPPFQLLLRWIFDLHCPSRTRPCHWCMLNFGKVYHCIQEKNRVCFKICLFSNYGLYRTIYLNKRNRTQDSSSRHPQYNGVILLVLSQCKITSAFSSQDHLATLKSVRLIWQSLFNIAFRKAKPLDIF